MQRNTPERTSDYNWRCLPSKIFVKQSHASRLLGTPYIVWSRALNSRLTGNRSDALHGWSDGDRCIESVRTISHRRLFSWSRPISKFPQFLRIIRQRLYDKIASADLDSSLSSIVFLWIVSFSLLLRTEFSTFRDQSTTPLILEIGYLSLSESFRCNINTFKLWMETYRTTSVFRIVSMVFET